MKYAITGATGQLGRLVIEKLKRITPAENIVALARSPEKGTDLGVLIRRADYDNTDTLEIALQGIDTLLLISSSEIGKRAEQHENVIAAAQKTGVKRIVYTSLLHADTSKLSLSIEHRETEKTLKASGISYTILRNGWYTENHLAAVQNAIESGFYYGSAKNGKISWATRSDYAAAAVAALTNDEHKDKTFELAGDEAFTLSELAETISTLSGRVVNYLDLPKEQYSEALEGAGFPKMFADAIADWDADAAENELFDDSRQLSALIGRKTTTLEEALTSLLQALTK